MEWLRTVRANEQAERTVPKAGDRGRIDRDTVADHSEAFSKGNRT